MPKSKQQNAISLRIPLDLIQYLKRRAVDNKRSFNAEAWDRLEVSREQDMQQMRKAA